MLTCEVCSASFEPSAVTGAVTTTRVLCPNCMAKRARARAQGQSQAAAPRAAAAAPARAAAPRRAAEPAPRRAAAERPAPGSHHHVSPMAGVLKKGGLIAGGLVVIALGFGYYAKSTNDARTQARLDWKTKVE